MTTANSLKTTDFPTSASNALSTTYDFSTSIGYTTIPHSKTYTATLNGQPMMKMTPIPDPSEELKDFKWTAWGNSEYRVIYNVNFDNAQVALYSSFNYRNTYAITPNNIFFLDIPRIFLE